jgi:hypothetical protein
MGNIESDSRMIYLASYPRSGNTLVRALLYAYLADLESELHINCLRNFIPADTSHELWNKYGGQFSDGASFDELWARRKSVLAEYRAKNTQYFAIKTHTANIEYNRISAFDLYYQDKVIYICRNPLDIAVSYADFNARDMDTAISIMLKSGAMVQSQEIEGRFEVRGSFPEHVASWLNNARCQTLLVRFDDLITDKKAVLISMLKFLEIPIDPVRVDRAEKFCRFEHLRKQEQSDSFIERPDTTRFGRFFRRGKTRQWMRELSKAQACRLADGCGDIMRQLGYAHPRDVLERGASPEKPVQFNNLIADIKPA